MTPTTALDIALGLALLAYIVSRQLRWIPVDTSKMWRMPLILGIAGLFQLAGHRTAVTTADVTILVLSAILAVASGVAMGTTARFRPITTIPARPSRDGTMPTVESRVGWVGVGLWFGLIGSRIALDLVGTHFGATFATSVGVILLIVAVNRAVRTLVFSARLDHHIAGGVRMGA
ncbi:hypothetical protein [Cryptosporangium phraense]|uniref:DUF1453 domain-containing protein n=1 Tax=Cryptosporangium phraense TaxID=2593070 RepID=A0A545AMU5_9ACTN|nr:hypothetical protein [Cryptosporangium phraense]TQS42642.1 hypothetical protein FL583_23415 [Cryptosporangium phraense]